jgi:PAS domain S-box-containing protein
VGERGAGNGVALPESLVRYATRTRETVILDDALSKNPFSADPYIVERRARSILCLPLINQGKLNGLLYLENNLTPRVFTRERITVLKVLASQAAISLENARLYHAIISAQDALRESERNLRSAIDGIPGLVAVLAPSGEIDAVNRKLVQYCGQSLEELKNWGTNGTVHPEDLPHVADIFTRSIASGIPYQIEQRVRRFDGEYRWFDNRGIPIRDDGGRIGRWYVLLTDIEDRNQALSRLQQMQSDFAHINRVSTMGELASSLAHEVLHPIATARNNARVGMRFLEMNPPNLDEVKEALACIVRDADRAKDIVGRVRDHIKKAPPRREHFDLNEALREAIFMVQGTVTREKIKVNAELMNEKALVQGDRVQLQQVVVNLVLNAIEAMSSQEKEAKELGIQSQAQADGVLVQVRDSGSGIDPANLERVFEPFYTTKMSGVGMGLSICRSIISGHGGRLWAETNTPRGAVFQFTLPARRGDL